MRTKNNSRNCVLVTGGAGFIGSAVIRYLIKHAELDVVNVDKLTYAGNLDSLAEISDSERYFFEKVDICDVKEMERIFGLFKPTIIMHLAAESHVDRSIEGPAEFINTNVIGTYQLLEISRRYWRALNDKDKSKFRFHHISTDEVYGSLDDTGTFNEESPYRPSSPYSASKASSDHLVRAWYHTFGLPMITTNCSNNYGPYQFPEKLIPVVINRALANNSVPVYGDGSNVRDWLYVEDHARALYEVVIKGRVGETYNIGGNNEFTNLDVVNTICKLLDEFAPKEKSHMELIEFVQDRPGHDQRYAIDASKIENELKWKPLETFESGIRKTVQWYLENHEWTQRVMNGSYRSGYV